MGRSTAKAGWIVAGLVGLGWLASILGDPPTPLDQPAPLVSPKGDETSKPTHTTRPLDAILNATETLFTSANVKLRSDASGTSEVITTIPKGTAVRAGGERDGWRNVAHKDRRGWVSSRYLVASRPMAVVSPTTSAVPTPPRAKSRRGEPIRAPYTGTCDCPYDRMRNGRLCGGNSAYSRPGGRNPTCFQ